jgi:hypothetical protein
VSLLYALISGTVFHAGYARHFTPPEQALAALTNLGTTAATAVTQNSPVQPQGIGQAIAHLRARGPA